MLLEENTAVVGFHFPLLIKLYTKFEDFLRLGCFSFFFTLENYYKADFFFS